MLVCLAAACGERERPDMLADPPLDTARRVVSGSFGVPTADAGAATGGASGSPGGSGQTDGGAGAAGQSGGAGGSSGAGAPGAAGAPSAIAPITQSQVYEASCDTSLLVQWGFVTFESTTPGDSFIDFKVRSAPSEAALPEATFIELISASSELGTSRCRVTGPAPSCPIDLFERLGGAPLIHLPFMEVVVVLHPASDGLLPQVGAWRMDYSCTEAQ